MYLAILSLFILIITQVQVQVSKGQCPIEQISECMNPINVKTEDILIMSKEMLTSLCTKLTDVVTCYKQKSINCTKIELVQNQSTLNVANYICSDQGKLAVQALQSCNPSVSSLLNLKSCISMAESIAKNQDPNMYGIICKKTNAYYSCYVKVSIECNVEAFLKTLYTLMNEGLNQLYGCNINYSNWDTQVYSQCNKTKFDKCMTMMTNTDLSPFIQYQLDARFLTLNADQVYKACSVISKIIDCISNEAKCEYTVQSLKVILGPTMSFQYICNIDRAGYNNLAKCYSNSIAFDSLSSCGNFPKWDCSLYLKLQKCWSDSSQQYCQNSTTIDNYLYENLQPMLYNTMGCILNTPSSIYDSKTVGTTNNETKKKKVPTAPLR